MIDEPEQLAKIRFNADMVVEQSGPLCDSHVFGFDEQSVRWLDGYIERLRTNEATTPALIEKLTSVFGSYLGECLVRCYGGRWVFTPKEGWRVQFGEKDAAFPFVKVQKRFANGAEDSIYSFFTVLPLVMPSVSPVPGGRVVQVVRAERQSWLSRLGRWVRGG